MLIEYRQYFTGAEFMDNLRRRFERFCYKHRNIGIPNLMLFIVLGNAIVYLMTMFTGNVVLYELLCFDRNLILRGEVWRLISYVLTSFSTGNIFLVAISYLCYYSMGRAIENLWGTFRFNLFYFSGVVLMDIFVMCLGGIPIYVPDLSYFIDPSLLYSGIGTTLNMCLFLAYATLYPDTHFLLFFIIPVKAWIFAVIDLVITVYQVVSLSFPINCFPHNLFPLVAITNYLLFFGKDVTKLFPLTWRANASRLFRKKAKKQQGPKVVPFPSAGSYEATVAKPKDPYTHRCTVCGRTDVSDPDLEFRYCSRCQGYHCYCIDHINNHTHVE